MKQSLKAKHVFKVYPQYFKSHLPQSISGVRLSINSGLRHFLYSVIEMFLNIYGEVIKKLIRHMFDYNNTKERRVSCAYDLF